jgi:hypothetical protein
LGVACIFRPRILESEDFRPHIPSAKEDMNINHQLSIGIHHYFHVVYINHYVNIYKHGEFQWKDYYQPLSIINHYTIWLFNMAMENHHF